MPRSSQAANEVVRFAARSRCGRFAYKSLLAKIFLSSIDAIIMGSTQSCLSPRQWDFELLVFVLFVVANYLFLRECRERPGELNDNNSGERRACSHCFPEMVNHLFEAGNSPSHSPRLFVFFQATNCDCDVASFETLSDV